MTDLRPIEMVCLRVDTILVISESSLATNSDVSLLSKKFYSQNKNKGVNKMLAPHGRGWKVGNGSFSLIQADCGKEDKRKKRRIRREQGKERQGRWKKKERKEQEGKRRRRGLEGRRKRRRKGKGVKEKGSRERRKGVRKKRRNKGRGRSNKGVEREKAEGEKGQ